VALASGNFESLAKMPKRIQGLAIVAAQILKIGAIVACLCGKFVEVDLVASLPALLVQVVRFLEPIDVAERISQIKRAFRNTLIVAKHLENLTRS
jgi:hypothetical protein